MKRLQLIVLLTVFVSCLSVTSAYSWILVDTSQVPLISPDGIAATIAELDNTLYQNFKNYPGAFAIANMGGYPIGDALIGDFPRMYFGISFSTGCANMQYYDEHVPRQKSVYPAYAPNPTLNFGFGLKKGFDLLFKLMIFTDAIYMPDLNQASTKFTKFNFYSLGFKLRKNLIGKKEILPQLFSFGGVTVSAGVDYMQGLMGINGNYNYTLNNIDFAGTYYDVLFSAYYNFNLSWLLVGVNTQAVAYINFLWVFDLYAGFGMVLTYGNLQLEGSGIGPLSNPVLGSLGYITAMAGYEKNPKTFMGLFIAGLEINIWVFKLTFETNVNISNGKDISLQLGTRFQF